MSAPAFPPASGLCHPLSDGLAMVLAPNPSPMTGPGTNTFLVGTDELAIIDPGPAEDAHLTALINAINGRPVKAIIVTHSHLDHSPLAHPLSDATDAPVYGFGGALAGQSDVMARLRDAGMSGGGEGVDVGFTPDYLVKDGDVLQGAGWTLEVAHTPGHMGNHIALHWGDIAFVGDLIMGWSTSLVSPPDGDMGDFLRSCKSLRERHCRVLYPAHGAPITDPDARITEVITHRQGRNAAILDVLRKGPHDVAAIVQAVYTGLAPALAGAAGRNVFAHLVEMHQRGEVAATPHLAPDATFHLRR